MVAIFKEGGGIYYCRCAILSDFIDRVCYFLYENLRGARYMERNFAIKDDKVLTERLVLRKLTRQDAPQMAVLADNKILAKNLAKLPSPYTLKDAEDSIAICIKDWGEKPFEFGIELKETGEFVGVLTLILDKKNNVAEFGYWLGESYWGRGYATEALKKVIEVGFGLGLHKIFGGYYSFNTQSGRAIEKCGFVQEGVRKEQILRDGVYYDFILYGLINPNDKKDK